MNNSTSKFRMPSNFVYGSSVILLIVWIIGFFAYEAGPFIHALPVLASILVLIRIIQAIKAP